MNVTLKSPIPEDWAVPARFRARLGKEAGRQRAMHEAGHVLLILHEVPSRAGRRARLFWRSPEGVWRTSGSAATGKKPLERHLEEYAAAIIAAGEQLERAESASDYFELLHTMGPLARAARNLHRALQDAREAAGDDRELIALRDRAYELERDAELLLGDARNGLDYTAAKRAEEQAEHSAHIAAANHRLNLIAALCLPLTAIASAFGMNVHHGLENAGPFFFVAVVAASIAAGAWLRARLS